MTRTPVTPEEKLLCAIFGDGSDRPLTREEREIRDTKKLVSVAESRHPEYQWVAAKIGSGLLAVVGIAPEGAVRYVSGDGSLEPLPDSMKVVVL